MALHTQRTKDVVDVAPLDVNGGAVAAGGIGMEDGCVGAIDHFHTCPIRGPTPQQVEYASAFQAFHQLG